MLQLRSQTHAHTNARTHTCTLPKDLRGQWPGFSRKRTHCVPPSLSLRLGGEGNLLLAHCPARHGAPCRTLHPPHPPFVYFKSWSSELYPGRKAPKHVGSQTSWNEACSCNGGRGEGCLKTPCTGATVGKVYMCLFVFVKKENLERLKDYVLYLDFYK